MSFQSTILYKKLQKQYSRRINLDLTRINKVLKKLGNPHLSIKNPINILGSDGKMSVLTSLKFFLESGGKKINSFTSPHLYNVRHRFWLKDSFISLVKFKKFIKIIEKTNLKLTLFEMLTCVYILASNEKKKISYNLIESGLLFKKDSTNLWVSPRAQIVTNINFQHQDWVNPKTLYEICKQKVGNLSNNTIIYIGKQNIKTFKIIKKLLRNNKSKIIYPSSWKIKKTGNKFLYVDKKNIIKIKSKYIHSNGLIDNLGLAIKVALDFGIKKNRIINTIPKIKFEGRLQYLQKGKLNKFINKNEKLLIDGCHSITSGKNLKDFLKNLNEPIYGVWGMQKNKMPEQFIKIFKNIFTELITLNIPNEINSMNKNNLLKIAKKNNFKASCADNIVEALKKITNKEKKTIVVFGSLYLVGHVLNKN